MTETFTNKYVVRVTHGHPGNTTYEVISTPEALTAMAAALLDKLENPDETLKNKINKQPKPVLLWHDFATIAHGQTSRVYLTFYIIDDLARYHGGPGVLKRLAKVLGCVLIIGCLYWRQSAHYRSHANWRLDRGQRIVQ
jgi:hypothetical protein